MSTDDFSAWPRRMANTAAYTKPSYRCAGMALEALASVLMRVCSQGEMQQVKYMTVTGEFVESRVVRLSKETSQSRNFEFHLDPVSQAVVACPMSDKLGFSDPFQVDLCAKTLRLATSESRRSLRILARELRSAAAQW